MTDNMTDDMTDSMTDSNEIVTFGCRLNSFESEIMRRLGRQAGLEDTIIVNSCAVTAEAERQTRQAIRRARRAHPAARIVVTGCAAEIDAASYAAMDEVDAVLGNRQKLQPESYAALAANRPPPAASAHPPPLPLIDDIDGRARAFIQVQNGCDHRCTFCIIPQGRGASRSLAPRAIAAQLRHLVDRGCREVVVSGVDIASYGADLDGRPGLGALIAHLLAAVPDLPRLRLSSLDPALADPELIDLVGREPRLMPHLHLSIQAGDDLILKRMKRRHDRARVLDLVADIRTRRPDMVFGADLIAGFPTETEAMHRATEDLVRAADLTYLHVFPYSPRAGTPAARMPQLPMALRRDRAARLRALGARQLARYLGTQTGRRLEILAETPTKGRTAHYAPVRLRRPVVPGGLLAVDITGCDADHLTGEAA